MDIADSATMSISLPHPGKLEQKEGSKIVEWNYASTFSFMYHIDVIFVDHIQTCVPQSIFLLMDIQ